MDLINLNNTLNEVGVIVMPGRIKKSATEVLLITGEHLPSGKYWAMLPEVWKQLTDEEMVVYCVIISQLNSVMHTVPIIEILKMLKKCEFKEPENVIESLIQQGLLKEVAKNYFINHNGLVIASPIQTNQKVKKSAKIIPFIPH